MNFKSLRDSERIKHKYQKHQVSKSVFELAHKAIKDTCVGKGNICAAKLLYLDSILGLTLSAGWLDHCVMGSPKTLERLKKEDDRFQACLLYTSDAADE